MVTSVQFTFCDLNPFRSIVSGLRRALAGVGKPEGDALMAKRLGGYPGSNREHTVPHSVVLPIELYPPLKVTGPLAASARRYIYLKRIKFNK